MSIEADLAVVGAGLAGLTAASRAAELGCRVVVVEKGEDQSYLCNSRIATGVLNVAHTDPHSDPAALRKAIEVDTEGYAAPALADALAATAGRAMQWLRSQGAPMIKVSRSVRAIGFSTCAPATCCSPTADFRAMRNWSSGSSRRGRTASPSARRGRGKAMR